MSEIKKARSGMVALVLGLLGVGLLMSVPDDADAISPPGRKSFSGWVGPYRVAYTDFQNDAGIKALAVTNSGKTIVEDIFIDIDSAFERASLDGGPTAVTMSLGKAGAVTRYKVATTVFTGATSPITGAAAVREDARGVDMNAYLLTTGTNASTLTAGVAKVYFKVAEFSEP